MLGMDRNTGKQIEGLEHLRQSIADILMTPIGSRTARRDYGSLLPELVDQPMNGAGRIRLFAATAIAIARWEKRFKLLQVTLTGAAGAYALQLEGNRADLPAANARTILTVPLRSSGTLTAYA